MLEKKEDFQNMTLDEQRRYREEVEKVNAELTEKDKADNRA